MALDLTNSNKLDEDFSGFVDYVPTALPQGDRLEDDFGGAANYRPAEQMMGFQQPVVPNIYTVGNTVYESTPYGYYLGFSGEEEKSFFTHEEMSFFTDDEKVANFIDEEFAYLSGDSEEYSNIFSKKSRQKLKKKLQGIGKDIGKSVKKLGDNIKKSKLGKFVGDKLGGGKAVHAVNKFNPVFVTMRGSMLSVLNNNVLGMADAIATIKEKSPNKRWEELMQKWWMFGGMKSRFDKAVMKGKGKKPLFKKLVEGKIKKGFDGDYSYAEGFYDADGKQDPAKLVLTASTLLGVATKVLTAIPEPATKAAATYTGSAAAGFGAMGAILKGFAKDNGATDQQIANIPEKEVSAPPIPTDPKELEKLVEKSEATDDGEKSAKEISSENISSDKFLGMPKAVGITVVAVGGLALLVGGYFLIKKMKK